jgi:hypothetical protein
MKNNKQLTKNLLSTHYVQQFSTSSVLFFTPYIQQLSHYSTRPELSGNEPTPVKLYANADLQKEAILRDNKGLSGVYR